MPDNCHHQLGQSDLDKQVSDKVADGRMTPDDAATVLKFRDFLRLAGPMLPWRHECGPTPLQQKARNELLANPEWRRWLGIVSAP